MTTRFDFYVGDNGEFVVYDELNDWEWWFPLRWPEVWRLRGAFLSLMKHWRRQRRIGLS